MNDASLADRVEDVRRFNRFYTREIGVLPEGHLDSSHSLANVRVLYEVAHRDAATATEIATDLRLDAGYMSRIVKKLEDGGLLARRRSPQDGRQTFLDLTPAGQAAFVGLNDRARSEVAALLGRLSPPEQERITAAMRTIERLLGQGGAADSATVLRDPAPGDLGWVVERHGALYAQEYGWDAGFEALVARIVAEFVEGFDPAAEKAWIAEHAGERVGSVFLVRKSPRVAKLRLLLVEPTARGLGIGGRLVAECESFARAAGYRKIALWTQSVLLGARRIYERAGYVKVHEEPHRSFGHNLVAETWELEL